MTNHRWRRAEMLPPERVTDHHYILGTICIVAAADRATELRVHTKEQEELTSHPGCTHWYRLSGIEHCDIDGALKRHSSYSLERARTLSYRREFCI